jgi:N-acetylneuraminic acid mutarotase
MGTLSNDVIFYLRGDSKKDISINSTAIITDGNPTINITEPSLSFNGTDQYIQVTGLDFTNFLSGDYTVEFEAKHIAVKNQWDTPLAIVAGNGADESRRSVYTHWEGSDTAINFYNKGINMASVPNGVRLNTWHHIAFVRSGNTTKGYLDGVYVGSSTANFTASDGMYIGTMHSTNGNTFFYGDIKNVMLTKRAKYSDNFTPQFDVYTSISVDNMEIINGLLTFSINKSDNEDIIKIEILSNDELIHTINDNFNDIQYDLNTANIEDNFSTIKIKVYYLDGKFVSAVKDYIHISLTPLDNNASIVDIKNTLQNIYEYQSLLNDTLYNTLTSKGYVISNEDKRMSTMITKVDEFTGMIKDKLVDALIAKGIECSTSNTFEELIIKVNELSLNPFSEWAKANCWLAAGSCTALPATTYSATAQAYKGKIYVIGGVGTTTAVRVYDPKYNTWASTGFAAMPTGRYGLDSTIIDDKIYCIGGYNNLTTNQVYDITNNKWTTLAVMPTGREYLTVDAVGTNIYAIGGSGSTTYLDTNQCYDTLTNTWTTKTVMTAAKYDHTSEVIGTDVYCIAGYTGSAVGTNYKYSTTTDTWTTMKAATARRGACCNNIEDKLYYNHGSNASTTYYVNNYMYDPVANTWTTMTAGASASKAKYRTSAVVNNMIFVFGGYNGSALNLVDCYIV